MEFIIEKCAMLVIEKGKIVKSVDIELPDGKVIKSLQEGEYLRTLEVDRFLQEEMKLKKIKVKKVNIKIEKWEFNSWNQYVRSVPFIIFSNIQ